MNAAYAGLQRAGYTHIEIEKYECSILLVAFGPEKRLMTSVAPKEHVAAAMLIVLKIRTTCTCCLLC